MRAAIVQNALRQCVADAGQCLQFLQVRRIDVDDCLAARGRTSRNCRRHRLVLRLLWRAPARLLRFSLGAEPALTGVGVNLGAPVPRAVGRVIDLFAALDVDVSFDAAVFRDGCV